MPAYEERIKRNTIMLFVNLLGYIVLVLVAETADEQAEKWAEKYKEKRKHKKTQKKNGSRSE